MAKTTIHVALDARHRAKVQFIATSSTCSLAEAIRRCIDSAELEALPAPTQKRRRRTKPEDTAAA